MKLRSNKWYGWKKDLPDIRDYKLSYTIAQILSYRLPNKFDLLKYCPPVYNQGALGSCTGQAVAGAIQIMEKQAAVLEYQPSSLFIYYNERVIEGTVNQDSGASIRDGIKSVAKWGVCDSKVWPYQISKYAVKPPQAAYKQAKTNTVDKYARVNQTLADVKSAIYNGYPVVFGFSVYDSFESSAVAKTGNVPLPNTNKESLLGGHAVVAIGWDESKQRFLCRNSWGKDWGMNGYFSMPYKYVLNSELSDDLWAIMVL